MDRHNHVIIQSRRLPGVGKRGLVMQFEGDLYQIGAVNAAIDDFAARAGQTPHR
jgi:hypothetical protein